MQNSKPLFHDAGYTYDLFLIDSSTNKLYVEQKPEYDSFLVVPYVTVHNAKELPEAVMNACNKNNFRPTVYHELVPTKTKIEYSLTDNNSNSICHEGALVVYGDATNLTNFISQQELTRCSIDEDMLPIIDQLQKIW